MTFSQSIRNVLCTVRGLLALTVAAAMVCFFFRLPLDWKGAWGFLVICWEWI